MTVFWFLKNRTKKHAIDISAPASQHSNFSLRAAPSFNNKCVRSTTFSLLFSAAFVLFLVYFMDAVTANYCRFKHLHKLLLWWFKHSSSSSSCLFVIVDIELWRLYSFLMGWMKPFCRKLFFSQAKTSCLHACGCCWSDSCQYWNVSGMANQIKTRFSTHEQGNVHEYRVYSQWELESLRFLLPHKCELTSTCRDTKALLFLSK